MPRKSLGKRPSLLDEIRKSNFLRNTFGSAPDKNTLTVEEFMLMLRKEKSQWNKLVMKSRDQVNKEVSKIVVDDKAVLSYLQEDDKTFLDNRPNYIDIVSLGKVYSQYMVLLFDVRRNFEDRCDAVCEEIEIRRENILCQLLDDTICSLCDDGYCTDDIHGLYKDYEEFCEMPTYNEL